MYKNFANNIKTGTKSPIIMDTKDKTILKFNLYLFTQGIYTHSKAGRTLLRKRFNLHQAHPPKIAAALLEDDFNIIPKSKG